MIFKHFSWCFQNQSIYATLPIRLGLHFSLFSSNSRHVLDLSTTSTNWEAFCAIVAVTVIVLEQPGSFQNPSKDIAISTEPSSVSWGNVFISLFFYNSTVCPIHSVIICKDFFFFTFKVWLANEAVLIGFVQPNTFVTFLAVVCPFSTRRNPCTIFLFISNTFCLLFSVKFNLGTTLWI